MWKKSETETPKQSESYSAPHSAESLTSRNIKANAGERSVLGASISIKGEISGEEDLLIEGIVDGKIVFHNNQVTIGKNGRIKADIHGKTISIDGNVEGNLFGTEQIIVRQAGTVRGNIVSPRVALEDGCNFKGNIDMSPKVSSSYKTVSDTPEIDAI